MKKFYYIVLVLLVVFGCFYANCSFALPDVELVFEQSNNYSANSIEKEYLVYIDEVKHTIKFEGKNEGNKAKTVLMVDDVEIRSVDSDYNIEFDKSLGYLDFGKDNFHFIKGIDDRTYLGIRFGLMLTIINAQGKILKHKPFSRELDYFNYVANYPSLGISDDKKIKLVDDGGNSVIEQEFFFDENFKEFDNRVSVKVDSDKFYSFILAPDSKETVYSYWDVKSPIKMYLNEYVISNDEIYYKKVKTFNIYATK